MDLSQGIVIVNEYTVKTDKGGSRGGTPGAYVSRYMARIGATETVTPVKYDTENFINRYMAREEATDRAVSVPALKEDMRNIQKDGGVAFGYGEVSLSHKKMHEASRDIQEQFDKGKTVLKTVISFDEQYLRENHIIDDDFQFFDKGDYRGNIDQMKLRMAIMAGIDNISRYYDDLQYIGVIQVDTAHVHCHLAMVDRGKGNIMYDGTQKGKISDKIKSRMRRGIDNFLDENQTVKMMTSNVEFDKRNTLCFVKKFTHKLMEERGFSQFLFACLPKDKSLWRADSHAKSMKKANAIVKAYVENLFDEPNSGYPEAMKRVDEYADARTAKERLTNEQRRNLIETGRQRIITESMNSVYTLLKRVPDEAFSVRTPMMEIMAAPYEVMAQHRSEDTMIEFGFKLRSYKSRLDYHKAQAMKYHKARLDYEKQKAQGKTSKESEVLYDFFKVEEEYNMKVMSKYQHFLKFLPESNEYETELRQTLHNRRQIERLEKMAADPSMKRMKPENAERHGLLVYDVEGGSLLVTDPQALQDRIDTMKKEADEKEAEFRTRLATYGMTIENGEAVQKPLYDFDEVKALDLHHLDYDFNKDFPISINNVDKFIAVAEERYAAYMRASEYLEKTGQGNIIEQFEYRDIMLQRQVAGKYGHSPLYTSVRKPTKEEIEETRTVRLDYSQYVNQEEDAKVMIRMAIESLNYDEFEKEKDEEQIEDEDEGMYLGRKRFRPDL